MEPKSLATDTPPKHWHPNSLLPWLALAVAVAGWIYGAGKEAAALQAAKDADAASSVRHEAQERAIAEHDDRIDYLCNERRRDNAEANRTSNGGC